LGAGVDNLLICLFYQFDFVQSGKVCNDCSFLTTDVATAELGQRVNNVFGLEARHLARAYLMTLEEFNPTNKTLVTLSKNNCT
jgi:hypothetical protein